MKPRCIFEKLSSRRRFLDLIYKVSPADHYFRKSDGWHHSYLRLAYKSIITVLSYCRNKERFVSKLQLGSKVFNEAQFLQDICEVTIAFHFAILVDDIFEYEKKVSPPTDVDFSFCIPISKDDGNHNMPHYKINCNLNFEVKCPKIINHDECSNVVKIHPASRFPSRDMIKLILGELSNRLSGFKEAVESPRQDNKLKDFLLSAQLKFKESDEIDVNTLIVCCDDELSMQDWRNYVVGCEGFFSNDPIINKADFNKTDVILLTNVLNRHRKTRNRKGKFINPWSFNDSLNLAYINPCKINSKWQIAAVASFFKDATSDFEEFFRNGNPPNGESADLKSILALAWFSDANAENIYFREATR